jgi:gamma-glutamylcyclotransferase (GGCT)/AIG2-like uncharacterized protein YtfP
MEEFSLTYGHESNKRIIPKNCQCCKEWIKPWEKCFKISTTVPSFVPGEAHITRKWFHSECYEIMKMLEIL